MTRLSYLLYCWATAARHQVPRRLTKGGLLVAGGLVLAAAIGSDLDQSVAFQSFAILFCLLLVGFGWAPFFRGRFEVCRALPRLASVGQPFKYVVEVRNETARPYRGLELLEDLADPRPAYQEFSELIRSAARRSPFHRAAGMRPRLEQREAIVSFGTLPELRPKSSATTEIELIPLKRGPLRFRGLTVARADPLGLVRGFVRVVLPQTVLVVPKRYPVPDVAIPGARQDRPGAMAVAASVGESDEFASVREYRPGDALRHVHWRSWARAGRPMVKEYQDESLVRRGLVLDTFALPGQEDLFEDAVSVAASFACAAPGQQSGWDLLFAGHEAFAMPAHNGSSDSQQVLKELAMVQPSHPGGIESLRELALRHAPLLGSCVCIFLGWDPPRQELVRALRKSGLPVVTLLIAGEGSEVGGSDAGGEAAGGRLHRLRPGHIAADLHRLGARAL